MTVNEVLRKAIKILKTKNMEAPAKEAGVLLAFLLERDVSWLYAHPNRILPADTVEKYLQLVCKRGEGMPFQYISGKQEFMSLEFSVNANVLIPRPETEILVENALSRIHKYGGKPVRVLDIGTGSGAIGISIACYAKNARVDAVELSEKALSVARSNAEKHQVAHRVRFIQADILQWEEEQPYALVLSNPPYIPGREIKGLMAPVRDYEPKMALDGGEDGLLFYRAIAAGIPHLLEDGGAVMVEVGLGQSEAVKDMFQRQGLTVSAYYDLAGIPRVVAGISGDGNIS